jgi:Domain of unknown function (DUF4158)
MDSWHATFLELRHLPREVTAFEIEAFYQFSAEECRVIEERRRPELKLALALQIGFLQMSGRLLEAVRIVPPLLWKHLGARFNVAAPNLASLRAMYRRAPTLIEHQHLAVLRPRDVACTHNEYGVLGEHFMLAATGWICRICCAACPNSYTPPATARNSRCALVPECQLLV